MAAKGIELASAYVSLSFSTDKLPQQLKNIARGMQDIEIDVDAKTAGATANMERMRVTQERRPVKIKVDVDTKRATKEVDALSSNLFKLGRSDFLKLNLGAAAISSLAPLATGLAEVASALQQVSQAALAVPGGIAGAVSSIGTLAFGLTGISDAYDSMNKAADEAAKSGKDVAAQARAQMSASFGLRNAIVDEADARKDVNRAMRDARRDLQDLNLEMRGGVISEKRAVNELQKARQRLYSGDYSDYQDALLDVEEAELRVDESRSRNVRTFQELSDANAKGVQNSDQVVAANERLIRSQQGVAQAEAGVAAAAPGATAAQENAALAMGKLSKNGQEFVNALMDVQGPVMELRNLVQDNIFEGMAGQLKTLTGKALPTLEKGLGGIGEAWNNTLTELFNVAGQDQNLSLIDRIFGNTEDAQNILNEAIDPLVEGLGTLTAAGTDALPRLAGAIGTVSERFAAFITDADADGRLAAWIDEGFNAMTDLGNAALNVGKMITAITGQTDGGFLNWLADATGRWQEWMNSVEGQNAIADFFEEGRRIFNEWRPILEDLPGLFKGIHDGAVLYIGALTDILSPITEFLKQHPDLVKNAAAAYLVFKSAQVLGSIATLGGALDGISNKFGTPGKSGTGLLGKLSLFTAGAMLLNDIFDVNMDDFDPEKSSWGHILLGPGFDKLFSSGPGGLTPQNNPGAPGVSPFAGGTQGPGIPSGVRPGAAVQPPGGAGAGGGNPLAALTGESGRDFAHRARKPYFESQGLTVGDHAADQYGEHQNGALDIMVGSISEGQRVLNEVLSDPNTYGAIFDNKVYGYGQGPTPRPYSAGNTGNPTQDHQDHVHVWYKPGNSNNIVPPQAAPTRPGAPMGPPSPAGPAAAAAPRNPTLDDLLRIIPKYDTGGVWPDGTLGMNTSGKPEFVLSPQDLEYLKQNGIDPNSLQHGTTGGAAPGPQAPQAPGRTEGYIPAAAGNTEKVGEGGLSNFLDLGESFVHNLIDTGAQAASMAASAAAGAASGGAGAAAGPAASTAIQMGAEALKRGVSWGYDMAGIWGEALVEQAFPFGAPRWLGSANPMAFMPQGLGAGGEKKAPGTMGAAKASIAQWAQPGNPAMANGTGQQGAQAALATAKAQPSYDAVRADTPPVSQPTQPPPQQQMDPMNPATWLNFGGVFDQGGMLPPKSFGMNLSKQPEYVMTQRQMAGMQKTAAISAQSGGKGDTNNFYATDVDGAIREWEKTKRRQSRRYSGRP